VFLEKPPDTFIRAIKDDIDVFVPRSQSRASRNVCATLASIRGGRPNCSHRCLVEAMKR
jgi:hypothetical protein